MTSEHMTAQAFTPIRVKAAEPVNGFELWIAVWSNRGRGEVVLGAPTLDELDERWQQLTHSDLDRDRAQHVVFAYHPHVEVSARE